MGLVLREYQQKAVDILWSSLFKKNRALLVAPCGSGKSETYIALCQKAIAAKPDIRIMIIVNKVTLVEQTARRMNAHIPTSVYCGSMGLKDKSNVMVASVQSAYKDSFEQINLIILDEAHRLNTSEDSQYRRLLDKLDHAKLKIVGVSATPFRAAGTIYGKDQFFPEVDYKITLEELWELGFLVKPSCKHTYESFDTTRLSVKMGEFDQGDVSKLVSDSSKVNAQIKDALPKLVNCKKVAWACANIAHAEEVRRAIGEDASIIHSKMSTEQREIHQHRFEKMNTRHIVFVNVLSEGYDFPPVDAIVLMCPTKSPVKYIQTVGRGLRPSPGKTGCLVLDYGRVIENCGPITDPRIPGKKESAKKLDTRMKFCPMCLEYVAAKAEQCPVCDHVFFKARKPPVLTPKSFEGSITELPTHRARVSKVLLKKITSSSGNLCVRIDYITTSLLDSDIPEYFVWGHPYAMRRLSLRLTEMGCTLKSTIEETIAQEGKLHVPSEIEYVRKKFTEIKRIIFTTRDPRLS